MWQTHDQDFVKTLSLVRCKERDHRLLTNRLNSVCKSYLMSCESHTIVCLRAPFLSKSRHGKCLGRNRYLPIRFHIQCYQIPPAQPRLPEADRSLSKESQATSRGVARRASADTRQPILPTTCSGVILRFSPPKHRDGHLQSDTQHYYDAVQWHYLVAPHRS